MCIHEDSTLNKLKSMLHLVLINKKEMYCECIVFMYRGLEIRILYYMLKKKPFKYMNGLLEKSCKDIQTIKN
jgi:hypothetical protein